eukprot:TRINITY_DN2270_c0_g1_i1.p2 TRINITY_DN2270_c0_g1~~TRINITY_DN2270_c0_g1_i1.p2  ORF type:complete len:119 (+),score=13.61 TRINITY_DN2270_c0_g1_i1:82-438(+)
MAGKHRLQSLSPLRAIAIASLIFACIAIRRDASFDDEVAMESHLVGSGSSQSTQEKSTAKDEGQDVDGDDSASENHMIGSSFSQSAQQALKVKNEGQEVDGGDDSASETRRKWWWRQR